MSIKYRGIIEGTKEVIISTKMSQTQLDSGKVYIFLDGLLIDSESLCIHVDGLLDADGNELYYSTTSSDKFSDKILIHGFDEVQGELQDVVRALVFRDFQVCVQEIDWDQQQAAYCGVNMVDLKFTHKIKEKWWQRHN